jgi:hypothetical protein
MLKRTQPRRRSFFRHLQQRISRSSPFCLELAPLHPARRIQSGLEYSCPRTSQPIPTFPSWSLYRDGKFSYILLVHTLVVAVPQHEFFLSAHGVPEMAVWSLSLSSRGMFRGASGARARKHGETWKSGSYSMNPQITTTDQCHQRHLR